MLTHIRNSYHTWLKESSSALHHAGLSCTHCSHIIIGHLKPRVWHQPQHKAQAWTPHPYCMPGILQARDSWRHQQLWEDVLPPAPCLAHLGIKGDVSSELPQACGLTWSLQTKKVETPSPLWCPQYFSLKWCTSNSQLKDLYLCEENPTHFHTCPRVDTQVVNHEIQHQKLCGIKFTTNTNGPLWPCCFPG